MARTVFRIFGYGAAFALLFLLDNTVESIGHPAPMNEIYSKVFLASRFSLSSLYPYIAHAGSAHKRASRTVVVTIGRDEPIKYTDFCERRALISDAVTAIAAANPSVIGVDYNFVASACKEDLPTELLSRALLQAATTIPIVLGQRSLAFDDLRKMWPTRFVKLKTRGFEESDLFTAESVPFVNLNPARIRVGLAQLNSDNRKIPLKWRVMSLDGSVQWQDTFALEVARASGLEIKSQRKIDELNQANRHPLGSLYEEEQLSIISAFDVICATRETRIHWPQCAGRSNEHARDQIQGRAVVLGLVDPSGTEDVHESVIGKVPGVILQANYVEALLSNTYLQPVARSFQVVIGICWFIAIEGFLTLWTGSLLRTIVYPLCLIAFLWMSINICLLAFGYYIELLFPSILVVLISHCSKRIEDVVKPKKEEHDDAVPKGDGHNSVSNSSTRPAAKV